MRYDIIHGEFGGHCFFIRDQSDKYRKVCGVTPIAFDGSIERAREMAIKICLLLNQDAEKGDK
jgi:hypothetical protein